ncbi:MAG: hypothetical protein ACOZNI_33635 [Myxococcota bacterium]
MVLVLLACESGDSARTERPPPTGETAAGDSADSGGAADDTAADTAATVPSPPAPCDAWGEPEQTGLVADVELDEISGVAPSAQTPGVLWVHEDRNNPTVLTAIDALGNTLGEVTLEGVANVDWEAIALAPCAWGTCLYVADIGDNATTRTDAALLVVPEPPMVEGLSLSVIPERIPVAYPDGAHNAEAFAVLPDGRGLVVTKRFDHTAAVFVLDLESGAFSPVAEIVTGESEDDGADAVTSADVWPDGSRLLLRTYGGVQEIDLREAGIDGVAQAPRVAVPYAPVVHVEAIAYDAERRGYWQIPEGINATVDFVPCLD